MLRSFWSFLPRGPRIVGPIVVSLAAIVITCGIPHRIMPGTGRALAAADPQRALLPISIDYPEAGSIFPPGITPPTFLWRDAAGVSWAIDITFADGSQPIHVTTKGERMQLGRD